MSAAASLLSASMQTQDEPYSIDQGDALMLPATSEHSVNAFDDDAMVLDEDGEDDEGNGSDKDSDDEDTKQWTLAPAPQPHKITEKRRADDAAFELWVEQNQHALFKRPPRAIVGDRLSTNALLEGYENKKIITSPRDYQIELFQRAKTQNTIAVLDTGKLIAAALGHAVANS